MIIKTDEDYFFIKQSSLLVGKTLGELTKHIKPGVQTKKLDAIAEDFIFSHGGKPVFKGYKGYPATLCISVNDVVVHGIPSETELKEGDIVSIDCGVSMNGYIGDYAYSFALGELNENRQKLLDVTRMSLSKGISVAITGNRTGDIGFAIQSYVESKGFSVVRELIGHGVGRQLHEKPEIPNYGKKGKGVRLEENMVICIEPMINMGKKEVVQAKDGWTIRTHDGLPSAHYEHMVIVKNDYPEVLSTYEFIEENIKKNIWLNNRLLNKMEL
jgi:methionyl aminopeptidase